RADAFIAALRRAGLGGAIVDDSFRDYTVKVAVSDGGRDYGNVNLYFSPKAKAFSLKTHELRDKSMAARLEDCWHDEPRRAEAPARGWQLYVDGSCINGATGYGVVVLRDGEVVAELCGPVSSADVGGTRQVAGELRAVEEGLRWCQQHAVGEIE